MGAVSSGYREKGLSRPFLKEAQSVWTDGAWSDKLEGVQGQVRVWTKRHGKEGVDMGFVQERDPVRVPSQLSQADESCQDEGNGMK